METTIAQAPNPTKVATKWALIGLAVQVVFTYTLQFLNLDFNSPIKWVGTLFFVVFMLLTQKEFRDELGGYLTFGQGFSAAFRYAIFAGLLGGVFSYVYFGILSPDVFAKMMETQRTAMAAKGMSSEDIDKAMTMTLKYGAIFAAFGVAIVDAVMGALLGLIGAAIFKKEKSPSQIMDELDSKQASDPTL